MIIYRFNKLQWHKSILHLTSKINKTLYFVVLPSIHGKCFSCLKGKCSAPENIQTKLNPQSHITLYSLTNENKEFWSYYVLHI